MNPREAENLEKEIAALKQRRDQNDERMLELFDKVPPAKAVAEGIAKQIEDKKKELAVFRQQALKTKAELEAEYKRLNEARPAATEHINPSLLARYDQIRKKHGGIGMAQIDRKGRCSACGTNLPTRTIEGAKEGRVLTCEECHRLLYFTEGLV